MCVCVRACVCASVHVLRVGRKELRPEAHRNLNDHGGKTGATFSCVEDVLACSQQFSQSGNHTDSSVKILQICLRSDLVLITCACEDGKKRLYLTVMNAAARRGGETGSGVDLIHN